jgi:hypothetical protein
VWVWVFYLAQKHLRAHVLGSAAQRVRVLALTHHLIVLRRVQNDGGEVKAHGIEEGRRWGETGGVAQRA